MAELGTQETAYSATVRDVSPDLRVITERWGLLHNSSQIGSFGDVFVKQYVPVSFTFSVLR